MTLLIAALAAGVVGCGSAADSSSGPTCDEYSQRPFIADGIGGETQSTAVLDLLEERGISWNVQLVNKLQSDIEDFCGKPGPEGRPSAKRNNSQPIANAIDWDQLR